MFDLRARTRNIDMRRTIEAISCTMIRTAQLHHTTTLHDPNFRSPYENTNSYPIMAYDEQGNELTDQHQQQQRLLVPSRLVPPMDTDQQLQPQVNIDTYTAQLLNIGVENLPCPRVQAAEPTELPLPRESIGLDLSWLSTGTNTHSSAPLRRSVPFELLTGGVVLAAVYHRLGLRTT